MFGPKSNIYISISPGYAYAQGEHKLYLKPHYVWMLTVESPKHSLSHKRDPNPIHYSVVWGEEAAQWQLRRCEPTHLGILGSILIQKNAPTSAAKLLDHLTNDLQTHDPSLQEELDGTEEESRSWIAFALQALQDENIVQTFDVEMFMAFSQAYLDRRVDGEGPARIAYSRWHKDHSQKEKKSFWISYPQAASHYDRSDVYGGLM